MDNSIIIHRACHRFYLIIRKKLSEENIKLLIVFQHIKRGDYLIFLLYLAIVILSFFNISSQTKPEFVEIRQGESTWTYNLDNYLVVQPVKDEGTCILLIENKTVRVTSSDCPLNICIQMGAIKEENQWIACLPHKIFISIKGSGEITNQEDNFVDAYSY